MFKVAFALLLASLARTAAAAPFYYEGQLLTPGGTPENSASVTFVVSIKSPAGCILYEEIQTHSMAASGGAFGLTIHGAAPALTANDPGNAFDQVFSNNLSLASHAAGACGAGYAPAANDSRLMTFTIDDGMGPVVFPDEAIGTVPYAGDAAKVAGFPASSLVRVTANGLANGAPAAAPLFSTPQAAELLALVGGTSAQYARNGANGSTQANGFSGAPSSPLAGEFWYDTAAHQLKYYDGTSTQVVSAAGGAVSGNAITSGTIGGSAAFSSTGNVATAGTVSASLLSAPSVTTGTIAIWNSSNTRYVNVTVPVSLGTNLVFRLPPTAGASGQVLATDGAGTLSWTPAGAAGVTGVAAGAGLTGGTISSAGTLAVNVGAGAGQIPQLNAAAQLPAVSGLLLTGLNAGSVSAGTLAVGTGGTGLGAAPSLGYLMAGNGTGGFVGGAGLGCSTTGQMLSWTVGTGFGCATPASGSVLLVAAGAGLSGGTVTSAGTLSLSNSGVLAGAYGSAGFVPQLTVDQYGRVTAAGSVALGSAAPTGAASGDLAGNYPSPTLAAVGAAGTYTKVVVDGKGRVTNSAALLATDLPTSAVAPGSYGSASSVPWFNVDLYGRLTSAGSVALSGAPPTGSASGDLTGSYPGPTLAAVGSAGTYAKVVVDAKGRVTGSAPLVVADLPTSAVAPGSYGSVIYHPWFNVDSVGRITSAGSYAGSVGSVTSVTAGTGLLGGTFASTGTLAVNVGAGAQQIPQLDALARLPAVGGGLLTGLNAGAISAGTLGVVYGGTGLGAGPGLGYLLAGNGSGGYAGLGCAPGQALAWAAGTGFGCVTPASGSVSLVAAGLGLSGGTFSSAGTLSLSVSGVGAGSYGSASAVPWFNVDTFGRVTSAGSVALAGIAPSGLAGGELAGTYPNPVLAAVGSAGTYAKVVVDTKGRVTGGGPLVATDLPVVGGGGTYGSATQIPQLTIDVYGRVTSAGTIALPVQWVSVGTNIGFLGGSVGIGTTAPIASLDVRGHVALGGSGAAYGVLLCAPAVVSGNDTRGRVQSAVGGGCTINFSTPYNTPAPTCVVSLTNTASPSLTLSVTATVTNFTVTAVTASPFDFTYICIQ